MTRPRKDQINVSVTPYYHIVTRCVRRAFLCGEDPLTKRNFDHRRDWIVERLRLLSSIFTIDICAYAIMSNHLHIVVKIDPLQGKDWGENDVIKRWRCLYQGDPIFSKHISGEKLEEWEVAKLEAEVARCKKELTSISRFMKCLNEPIARQANKEDKCTGHFWESRFKSQPILSEQSLLACMAYVDLNPIRAGMATTPEDSTYTSLRERLLGEFEEEKALKSFEEHGSNAEVFRNAELEVKPLLAFATLGSQENLDSIPCSEADYIQLVDNTGRVEKSDKMGKIPGAVPSILHRLGIEAETWLVGSLSFEKKFKRRSIPDSA